MNEFNDCAVFLLKNLVNINAHFESKYGNILACCGPLHISIDLHSSSSRFNSIVYSCDIIKPCEIEHPWLETGYIRFRLNDLVIYESVVYTFSILPHGTVYSIDRFYINRNEIKLQDTVEQVDTRIITL